MADSYKIAYSLSYGYLKQFRTKANDVKVLIQEALFEARKIMQLPKSINFVVRPLGGKYNGLYVYSANRVEIDPRKNNLGTILSTLMHELVHVEQFHTGRLKHTGGVFQWEDVPVHNKGTTYSSYMQRPWEQEAFARQVELALKVSEMIAIKHGVDVSDLQKLKKAA